MDNSKSKPKAKMRLLDDIEAGPSHENKRSKTDQNGRNSSQNISASTKNTSNKGKNTDCIVNKLDQRQSESKAVINKVRKNLTGRNNNATKSLLVRSSAMTVQSEGCGLLRKVIPIIQTRGMKAREFALKQSNLVKPKSKVKVKTDKVQMNKVNKVQISQDEINRLDLIDQLTADEIAGGDSENELAEVNEICHDGIELSINSSDIDEDFPEDDRQNDQTDHDHNGVEPGELSSSSEDEYEPDHSRPQSKVTKVTNKQQVAATKNNHDRYSKFAHLYHDPDFKQFLNEVIDERTSTTLPSGKQDSAAKVDRQCKDSTSRRTGKGTVGLSPSRPPLLKSPSDTTIYSPGL